MPKVENFFEELLGSYINKSRSSSRGNGSAPPTPGEIKELIDFLGSKGLDPIIVGSLGVYLHLKKKGDPAIVPANQLEVLVQGSQGGGMFRPTHDADFFVTKKLPTPPDGWRVDKSSIGVTSWISPSKGCVDFLVAGERFPNNSQNPSQIDKDPDFARQGCPVADLASLYQLKLNSDRMKDSFDLLALARVLGIPKTLAGLNQTQKENLETLQLYLTYTSR